MGKTKSPYAAPPVQQITRSIETLLGDHLPKNAYPCESLMVVHGETKYLSWDFSKAPFKTLELIQITDMQMGHICCQADRVVEYRDWVLSRPNRYMIWTGDNIDSVTMESKGTSQDNLGTPQKQMYDFLDVWRKARHRILGYVGGNHERRCVRTFGDLGISIAALLRIPYSSGKQLIDITFGHHRPFQISQWHGVGGARTKGTVAQVLTRFAAEGDSQLYLMGHLHQPMIIPMWKERRDPHGAKGHDRHHPGRAIAAVKSIAALGSSFLDNWGSYGEVAGYAQGDVLMPRCVLDTDGGWEVTLR